MGKVLSQQEIDTLLSALSSGEIDAEKIKNEEESQRVKNYDFRRPNKLAKEHLHTIEMIYENYSRVISNYLSGQTRSNVKIKVVSAEQVTYEEFVRSIPNPTLLSVFHMTPLEGSLLFEVNPKFAFQVIDLLCGGSAEKEPVIREFTDIEKSVISDILNKMIENMKLAWEDIIDVDPVFDTIETNPQLNQTMAPNDPVALVTFTTDIVKTSSFMNLCIPYRTLEKIIDKLYVQHSFKNTGLDRNGEFQNVIEQKIGSSKVDLQILLGRTQITIEDFIGLRIGDVLALDKKATEPLKMYVEDRMHFLVQPGIYKEKLSVQVVEFVEKDVEDDE